MERQVNQATIRSCERAMEFAARRVRRLVDAHPDYFPMYTVDGQWKHGGEKWTNWCEGFLGGQLWLFYEWTADPWWRRKAEHYSRLIEHRKSDREVHDLGFLFMPTWGKWHELTGDPRARQVVIEAGRTLAKRFREKGGYLCSFVGSESVFIDIMMNVGIIFYAARETGDEDLWRIGRRHCLTTRRYLVRGDGSTAHEGLFDTRSGAFLRHSSHQGWRADSSWARGQAWALSGFAAAYGYTGDERFLDVARRCADYYVDRTPPHGVPPNDWDEPRPELPCESSAAAIAADGMLELAGLVEEPEAAERYRRYAERILRTLTGPEFLADTTPGWEGILKHGIYHLRKGLGVDESVIWGDYFFVKAVRAACGESEFVSGETPELPQNR